MSEAPIRNLVIEQGVDWSESFQILDSTGAVVNLAGCSIIGEARRQADRTTAVAFSFTFAINFGTNTITVSVARAITTALTVGKAKNDAASKFYYEYKLTDSLGLVDRIQQGTVTVSRQVAN